VVNIFSSSKVKISDLEQLSQTHSADVVDPFDDHSEPPTFDILVTETGKEAVNYSDVFLKTTKGCDDANPHDIELKIRKMSLDEVIDEASNHPSPSRNKKPNRSTSLPTVREEMTEELLPTDSSFTNNMDLNLDASVPPIYEKENSEQESAQKRNNSSSLPETGDTVKLHPLMKGMSSIEKYSSGATASKPDCHNRTRTTSLGSSSGAQDAHHLRRPSLFLNDDELHIIWKPDATKTRTASVPMLEIPSTFTMLPATDPGLPKSNQRKRNSESGSISSTGVPEDLWLRQKQLQERVSIAREVAKDQNITLVKPEVSQDEKRNVLQFASKIVSYHISKKPKHLDDVVLQAIGNATNSSKLQLKNSDQPLSLKEKWQKAILLSANPREKMKPPSRTSRAGSHPEIQPVSVHKISQRMNKMSKNPFLGTETQSQSDCNFSALSKIAPPNKRHEVKSPTTVKTEALLEDVDEVENESDKEILVTNVDNTNTTNSTANSTSTMTIGENRGQIDAKEVAANSTHYSYSDKNKLDLLF